MNKGVVIKKTQNFQKEKGKKARKKKNFLKVKDQLKRTKKQSLMLCCTIILNYDIVHHKKMFSTK